MKMEDDEQLEKLFEGMSREAAREIIAEAIAHYKDCFC